MILWAGKEYEVSYYIAIILILPLCIPLIQNLGISIMQAKNMHKFRSILYAVIAIANIAVSIPLAKLYGGIGSAIGTSISLIIGNGIIINIYYHKKVGINVLKFWKEIIKMTIPNIIPIAIVLVAMQVIKLNGYIFLLVFGGIYTILYMTTCYLVTINSYEKEVLHGVLKRLKLRKA